MGGRELLLPAFIIPAWIVVAMSGWRGLKGVWPAVLVCGATFSIVQLIVSNFFGPTLVDISAGLVTMIALIVLMRFWHPAEIWRFPSERGVTTEIHGIPAVDRRVLVRAWMPWILMSMCVFIWGTPSVKTFLSGGAKGAPNLLHSVAAISVSVPALDNKVYRDSPVVPKRDKPEPAVYNLNILSATGSGIVFAAIISALYMRISRKEFLRIVGLTLYKLRYAFLTIACMLGLGYTTRYSGMDATLGLAFTRTGAAYPFFASILGWLGTAVTGSDTSSNALFGSLQRITAEQLHLSPILIATSNSTGGVMGKMLDAQSIVVSAAAINHQGEESNILRFVFRHSIALVCIMGIITLLLAYVLPGLVP
jgi:lactate permease